MNTNQQPDREKEIFEQAVEISAPQERQVFLKIVCIGDPDLHARVQALLSAHDDASKFLGDKPAAPGTIRLTVPDEEKLGTLIGRYKLLEKVGEAQARVGDDVRGLTILRREVRNSSRRCRRSGERR